MKKLMMLVIIFSFLIGCAKHKSQIVNESFLAYPECSVYTTVDNDTDNVIILCDKDQVIISYVDIHDKVCFLELRELRRRKDETKK